MKRYVVISSNDNCDYAYYIPLACWAWRKIGWEPIVLYLGDTKYWALNHKYQPRFNVWPVSKVEGYRDDTVTQISRLYAAASIKEDSIIMTSDVDMIPLSDYWHPADNEITVYGHDLTGFGHFPICYLAMNKQKWVEVMGLYTSDLGKMIKRDLDSLPQAKDPDFYKYWFSDQDLATKRISENNWPKTHILRGQLPNGYAKGRVDRGAWSLDHEQFIDCHMLRDCYKKSDQGFANFAKVMTLLDKIWPEEDFTWLREYTKEFQKLANNG